MRVSLSDYKLSYYYVSELALVTHQPRAASAYAMGPVKCAGKRSEVELNIAARDTDCCFLFGL